jgi:hypothetical protein
MCIHNLGENMKGKVCFGNLEIDGRKMTQNGRGTPHKNVDWIYPDQWTVSAEWTSEIHNLWHMSPL